MTAILHYDIPLAYAVLNKPSGVDTVGFVATIADNVVQIFRPFEPSIKIDQAFAVHRLDKPTSGCLVVGVNHSARRRLSNALMKRKVEKRYLAVLRGTPSKRFGIIDVPLTEQRVPINNNGYSVIRVDERHGKPATTIYNVLSRGGGHSLVELLPITGRTHQLRVHCAHIGHPIVGDSWYPSASETTKLLHLHAHRIILPKETFGGVEITAQMPPYMRETLGLLPGMPDCPIAVKEMLCALKV